MKQSEKQMQQAQSQMKQQSKQSGFPRTIATRTSTSAKEYS